MKQTRFITSVSFALVLCSMRALANTALWIGNPGVSVSTNWSDNANWNNVGGGGAGYNNNDVVFGGNGSVGSAATINSVADVTAQAFSITFTNGPSQFHTILIPTGTTLTNANSLTIGNRTADAYTTVVGFVGGGTFVQNGANLTNQNYGSAASTALATLDLSGLTNFVYNNSGGTIHVGGTGGNRSAGSLNLAAVSNSITVGTLNVATGNGANAATSSLKLGTGTNILNVGTFNLVNNKNSATVNFVASTGGLRIRGVGGTDSDRANFTIANRNQTGTGTASGNLSLNGHPVDIKAGTMIVGQNSAGSSVNTGSATVQFDSGTLDATNISMAVCSNPNAGAVANGTVTVGASATLSVGAGGISLANITGTTLGSGAGTLNVNGGTTRVSGNIRKATTAGTGNISVNGGTLNMTGPASTIGASGTPIDSFTVSNATLTLPVQNGVASAVVNFLGINGTSDTINISSLPGIASYPAQFPVIAYLGLAGTFDFVLGTVPGTYQGYISNNIAASSVDVVITNSLAKTDVWRGNVNGNWDLSTLNWSFNAGSANFQQGDSAVFDDTLTGTANVTLTTNLIPSGVSFNNSSSNYVFSGPGKITGGAAIGKSGTGSVTLAGTGGDDFSGGIVVNDGLFILDNTNSAITGGLGINGGTVQIGKNDGNGTLPAGSILDNGVLAFNRSNSFGLAVGVSGSGAILQNGSGTLTVSAPQLYTGNTIVSNGTLALTASGTISNSSQVIVQNATLDVSALGRSLISSLNETNSTNTVAVNASGLANISATSVTAGGTANRINVSSLPPISSYPVTFPIIQSGSPIGGTFNFVTGTLPAATPAYAATVTESVDQLTVLLTVTAGPVAIRPGVVWTGGDVPNLNTNWSDRLNWQLPGAPGAGENVFFSGTAAVSSSVLSSPGGGIGAFSFDNVNNIVDGNFTIAGLTYTNTTDNYHNTFINSGRTLTATNGLGIGVFDTANTTLHEFVTISGTSATLALTSTNANMQIYLGSANTTSSQATLDLSALDTFNATVGRLLIGATINNVVNRPSGILYLAKTNSINAGFQTTSFHAGTTTANAGIVIGDCNQNAGPTSAVLLGRVNTIGADTIAIGRQKATAILAFNSIYANIAPYPTVNVHGFTSSRVVFYDVGDGVGNTGTTVLSATNDFSGGIVTALVDTMDIGRGSGPTSGTGGGSILGALTFDAGTINVNTLNLGAQPTGVSAAKAGVGILNVCSNTVIGTAATLSVNGTLNLAFTAVGGSGAAATAGTLNITNGTALVNAITPGTNSQSFINLIGGQLAVTNASGSPAAAIGTLTLAPLGTPDNSHNFLQVSAPGLVVTNLNIDALDTTTNVISVGSVANFPSFPTELPLIQYSTLNFLAGSTFNIVLGTLPPGFSGYLTNDTASSMIAVVITNAPPKPARITGFSIQSGNIAISGTNGYVGTSYHVIASTNVMLPFSAWTKLATNTFDVNGNFSQTIPVDPTKPNRFFSIEVPPPPQQ